MPGCFIFTASLCTLPSSCLASKPRTYWLCSSCATRVKVGAEIGRLLQLEVAAAGFVGQPPQSAVRLAAHHAHAVEELALESDRVDHHFFGAGAVDDHRPSDAARRVVAVGEHEITRRPSMPLQLVEAVVDRVAEPRAVAVVEILARPRSVRRDCS